MSADERSRWVEYLEETPTYGTYFDRRPEYQEVWARLFEMGVKDGDLIVDVGAGTCDFDRFLRTEAKWNGRYWPIDGAVQGIDFQAVSPAEYLPAGDVDWIVCIETIEHVDKERNLLDLMLARTKKGIVVTTPNGDVQDVIPLDPTHVCGWTSAEFEKRGMTVHGAVFNPGRPMPDTLIAFRRMTWTDE